MEYTTRQKLLFFFPVFFAFCLPFGSLILSGIVVLWTLTSFFNVQKEFLLKALKKRVTIICLSFFFLTLLSAVFSDHKADSLFAVEISLGFILFPYLIFGFDYPYDILKRCIVGFVSGCMMASLFLIARSVVLSNSEGSSAFFYTRFSWFIHAGYFSMYLVTALSFVVIFYSKWFVGDAPLKRLSFLFVTVFVITVFLCASKLGLISLFVIVPLLLAYRFRKMITARNIVFAAIVVSLFLWLSTLMFPGTFARLQSLTSIDFENIDRSSSESTTVRILIWKEALKLIADNWLLGVGAGDANQALYTAYAEQGMTGALSHHLNAHNQFLQTFVGMGLTGMLLLLLLTFGELFRALGSRNWVLSLFLMVIILNFLVESMLLASAGVLFFLFFLCLLQRIRTGAENTLV